jgi:hypothetical protein
MQVLKSIVLTDMEKSTQGQGGPRISDPMRRFCEWVGSDSPRSDRDSPAGLKTGHYTGPAANEEGIGRPEARPDRIGTRGGNFAAALHSFCGYECDDD